jgi:site-specific DNA-methyltransferase (adenine-specific)
MQPEHTLPTPVFEDDYVTLYCGDCRDLLPLLGAVDAVVADPPYGDTSLEWDRIVDGWLQLVEAPQLWCFGSLRHHLAVHGLLEADGWKYGQEIVWEKHNGSGFAADRFKRVHEIAAHWYRGPWGALHLDPPVTLDATARQVRRKQRPTHMGDIGTGSYVSEDGGPRLMRSVIYARSEHGRAVHPMQKPLGVMRPLVTYSVPVGGLVLDPFAGSGSTLLVARETGRRAIGIEIDPDYCARAVERLAVQDLFSASGAAV